MWFAKPYKYVTEMCMAKVVGSVTISWHECYVLTLISWLEMHSNNKPKDAKTITKREITIKNSGWSFFLKLIITHCSSQHLKWYFLFLGLPSDNFFPGHVLLRSMVKKFVRIPPDMIILFEIIWKTHALLTTALRCDLELVPVWLVSHSKRLPHTTHLSLGWAGLDIL